MVEKRDGWIIGVPQGMLDTVRVLEDTCLLTSEELQDLDFMLELKRLLGEDRALALIGASKMAQVLRENMPAPARVS